MTSDERVIEVARTRGEQDGKAAASWIFDGNTPTDAYARVLRGIEEGDPAVLDTLPSPDLSGQWADSPSGQDVVRDILNDADVEHVGDFLNPDTGPDNHAPGTCDRCDWWDAMGEILDAYEAAFSEAVSDEVERMARYHLGMEEPATTNAATVRANGLAVGDVISTDDLADLFGPFED